MNDLVPLTRYTNSLNKESLQPFSCGEYCLPRDKSRNCLHRRDWCLQKFAFQTSFDIRRPHDKETTSPGDCDRDEWRWKLAIQSFEDLGYFYYWWWCRPGPSPKLCSWSRPRTMTISLSLVVDIVVLLPRDSCCFRWIENQDDWTQNLFDAADKELVARYAETRRSHLLAADGRIRLTVGTRTSWPH